MRTCLVVDDSSVIRKVARRILEGLDFQIIEAEDGEKALEVCKRGLPDTIPRWCSAPPKTMSRTSRVRFTPGPTSTS